MRVLILVVVVACGGTPPVAKPVPAGASCAAAADGLVGIMPFSKDPKVTTDAADAARKLIIGRCDGDQWSPEARRCFKDMKTADDANVCGTLLTDDQQASLVKAQEEKSGAKQP